MSKLYCSSCESEITSKDRFCPNCAENNEDYIEVLETKEMTSRLINQPIKGDNVKEFCDNAKSKGLDNVYCMSIEDINYINEFDAIWAC